MSQKEYYLKNRKKIKKRSLEYYYKNRKKVLAYQIQRIERLRKENPEFHKKYNARHRAAQTIPLKGKVCVVCGKPAEQRHHKDYDKPKDIKILCRKCHKTLSMKNK